jgi:hypothetical protein
MGAQRWIDLGFIRLQPSEMMKFTLVMLLAPITTGWTRKVSRPLWVLIPVASDRGADRSGADAAEPWHLADADPGGAGVMFAAGSACGTSAR